MAKARKAGMSTGVEVARITVKVSPNTRQFARELRDELKDIERQETVDLSPEEREFKRKVRKTVREATASVEKGGVNKIRLDADSSSIEQSIKSLEKLRDKLKDPDIKSLRQNLDLKFDKRVMNFRLERLKPVMEAAELRAESSRVLKEFDVMMDKVRRANYAVDVALNPNLSRFNPKVIRARLQRLFNRESVKFNVEPAGKGGKSGSGSASDLEEGTGFLRRIRSLISKIEAPNFGTGINPTGYLVIATLLAAVLAPLAGILTSLLLTLPGLISLVLTPIAALTLGLDGLKKAAEVLKEPFQSLRETMNAAVGEQFAPVFASLTPIFDVLKQALPSVSKGMADITQSIVNAAEGGNGFKIIGDIVSGIGSALSAAAPGFGSLSRALLDLTESFVNGGALTGLVEWFNGAMNSFDQFVAKLKASGDLDRIFAALGEALKIVADVFGQIAAIGIETMLDPQAWMAFTAILRGTGDILVFLFAASKSFLSAVGAFGKFLLDTFASVAPFLAQAANLFSNLGATLAGLWAGLVSGAANAWSTVVGLVQGAVSTVSNIVSSVPGVLAGIWNGIVSTAQAAWNGIVSAVQSAWSATVSAIQSGISQAVALVAALPGQIASAMGNLANTLVASGKALIQGFINGIKGMIGAAVDAARSVVSAVRNLFPFSPAKEGPFSGKGWVYNSGKSIGQGLADGITDSTKPAVEAARELAAEVKKAMDAGGDGSTILGDVRPEDLKTLIAAIEEEKKRLKIQKNSAVDKAGKAAVQQQIDQLQAQKDILAYQQDRIKNQKSLNTTSEGDPLVKAASGLMNAPVDFAKATGKQFLTDLGVSGDGLISRAITEGIQYIFNIGSVDDALSIKDRQESKQALAIAGR